MRLLDSFLFFGYAGEMKYYPLYAGFWIVGVHFVWRLLRIG